MGPPGSLDDEPGDLRVATPLQTRAAATKEWLLADENTRNSHPCPDKLVLVVPCFLDTL
jgi:hypothetical protein